MTSRKTTPDQAVELVLGPGTVDTDNPLPTSPQIGPPPVYATLENGTESSVGAATKVWSAYPVKMLVIQNTGTTNNVRVGKSGVTATTGTQLRPGQALVFVELIPNNDVYAIAESGTSTVVAQVMD